MNDVFQQRENGPAIKGPREFEFAIEGVPDFSRVTLALPPGGTIKAEASVMIGMDTSIRMKTRIRGGFRRIIAREKLFINEFTAGKQGGEVTFASGLPGDIDHYYLDGQSSPALFLQAGAFLAAGEGVDVQTKWQGMIKGFFSGAGLFLIKCQGMGDVFFNSYGGIVPIAVNGRYTVDTNHIVGFTGGLDYKIRKFGGYKSFFFSGEGLVAEFFGEGTIWVQTRNVPAFTAWVYPFRPVEKASNNGD